MSRLGASILAAMVGSVIAPLTAVAAGKDACTGEYAEDLSAQSPRARATENAATYSYAVRTSATYECVSYGGDGSLRRSRATARAYGTAFGYRHDGTDTLLLTNEHVADWPAVTDDARAVDGVPTGCKKIFDSLTIVDDDDDTYAADDIPLTREVVDPVLDVAVLRAHTKLPIIPWRVGRSAALMPRSVVQVKGYPLGEFQATNVGKVVSTYDHDVQGARDHDDFVIDALLTSGGSGSPVFAVSCKTGEFELVGIFHARYRAASALNLVVAIDQVRDLMTTLKRSPRPSDQGPTLDASARARLIEAIRNDPDPPYFVVGSLTASVRVRGDGAMVFAVFSSDFPRTSRPLLVVEDLPGGDPHAFGSPGATYVGSPAGLHVVAAPATRARHEDSLAVLSRTLTTLRQSAVATYELRAANRATIDSRAAATRLAAQKRAFERMLAGHRDPAQAIVELASREARTAVDAGTAVAQLRDIEADPPAPARVVAGAPVDDRSRPASP